MPFISNAVNIEGQVWLSDFARCRLNESVLINSYLSVNCCLNYIFNYMFLCKSVTLTNNTHDMHFAVSEQFILLKFSTKFQPN